MTPMDDPTSIGNILVRMGLVTDEQLHTIHREQERMREDLLMGNLMVARGWITRDQLELALAAQKGLRNGGRNGQAMAVANISIARQHANQEQRERVIAKSVRVEQSFLKVRGA